MNNDKFTIRAVVNYLGLIAVLGLLGIVWLVHDGVSPDRLTVVVALVAPATGALGALLASTRTSETPQPTTSNPTVAWVAPTAPSIKVGDAAP